ncbi:MAG: WD40 repeat domain-containing protein [Verrucomicrobiota bacterium]
MRRRCFLKGVGAAGAMAPATLTRLRAAEHEGPVTSLLVQGQRLFSASQGGIFEGRGESLKRVRRPEGRVLALAGNRNFREWFFCGGRPGEWGMVGCGADGQTRRIGKDLVYDVALSKDGEVALATGSGRILTLPAEDWLSAVPVRRHEHTGIARAVGYGPDGLLASAGLDGALLLSQDRGESVRILKEHTAPVECLAFSEDGRWLASGARDGRVRLHDPESGRLIRTYSGLGMEDEPVAGRLQVRVLSLCWCEGGILAGVSNGGIYDLSLKAAEWKRRHFLRSGPVFGLADHAGIIVAGSKQLVGIRNQP